MKILFISSFYLYKDTRFGGSKRLYSIADKLAEDHELHLVHFDGCYELDDYDCLPPTGFENQLFLSYPDKKPLVQRLLTPGLDISKFLEAKQGEIEPFVKGKGFDLIVLAFPLALSFLRLKWLPECDRVCYIEDDLLIEKIRYEIKNTANLFLKIWRKYRNFLLKRYYRAVSKRVDRFIAISEEEKRIASSLFPNSTVTIFKYGIRPDGYQYHRYAGDRHSVGFIGNYKHTPNMDALGFLLNDILPYFDSLGYRLVLAGKGLPDIPPEQRKGGVMCLGEVESLEEFYREVDVFINPIISGRGLRTKVVEAAAAGIPVVSTSLGAEGLGDLTIIKGEDAQELVSKLRTLFNDKSLMRWISAYNREIVMERYNLNNIVGREFLTDAI